MLPNNNVLVTEANKGHVFEVTRKGKIVWEFWNPYFNETGKRLIIYRMLRLTADVLNEMSFKSKLKDSDLGL